MLVALFCVTWTWSVTATAHAELLRELRLSTGPHAPGDAPDVISHVPTGYDAKKPLDLVVFLHGFEGCTRALVSASSVPCRSGEPPQRPYDLAHLHALANTNSILIVPQLAFRARTAHEHRYRTRGAFDAMLGEVLASLRDVLGPRTLADVHGVTLVAHSAGYGAVVPILRDASRLVMVRNVVMLDASYAGWDELARWALGSNERRLVSLHTAQEATTRGNGRLLALLETRAPSDRIAGSLTEAVRSSPVLIARVRTAHGAMPEAHFAEVLAGLPLERRATP